MASIFIFKKPEAVNFSRNAIEYGLKVLDYNSGMANSAYFKVQLFMESAAYQGDYSNVYETKLMLDSKGFASIDVSAIIDAHLEFFTPKQIQRKFYQCKKQSARFYVVVTLEHAGLSIAPFQVDVPHFAVKGGVAKEQWTPTALQDQIITAKKPLHYLTNWEYIRPDEPKFLYFILGADANTGIKLDMFILGVEPITDVVASTAIATQWNQYTSARQYTVWCVPVDYTTLDIVNVLQASLPTYVPNVYTLKIKDLAGAAITEVILHADLRPYWQNIDYILYRNSLGGMDTQSLTGQTSIGIDVKSSTVEKVQLSKIFGSALLDAPQQRINITHQHSMVANTGYITRAKLDTLTDLLIAKEAPFVMRNGRKIPIIIRTDKLVLYTNKQMLYNLVVEYSPAFDDVNFTQTNFVPYVETCPAVVYMGLVQKHGNKLVISWQLPEGYDKAEITWNTGSGANVFLVGQDYGEVEINCMLAVSGIVQVSIRVVCNDEVAPFSYGPATMYVIFVELYLPPIAVENTADITYRGPGARVLQLGGIDMNVIANDVDANGLPLFGYVICDATGAATTTSTNGATVGIAYGATNYLSISYTPTTASLANTAQDAVHYRIQQLTGGGALYSNIAKINIPMTGQVPKVWVKMVKQEVSTKQYKYGFLNLYNYPAYDIVQDAFLLFYKDAACTLPIDVTGMGLVIGHQETTNWQNWNSFGAPLGAPGSSIAPPSTVTANGLSMPLLVGWYAAEWDSSLDRQYERTLNKHVASSVGNWVAVGF